MLLVLIDICAHLNRPGGYTNFLMLNSTEHEISTADEILTIKYFFPALKQADVILSC